MLNLVKEFVPLMRDTLPLICSILSVYFVAKRTAKISQQTVFSMQIETLNGIYACMDVVSSKNHWPTCLNDMDEKNIDNFKSVPHELELLNAWLSNLWTKGTQYNPKQIHETPITISFTTKLWFQTKCLWPARHTNEALSFLANYREIQSDINKLMNGYWIAHPGVMVDEVFKKMHSNLLPSYVKLVNSRCLNQMENDIIKNLHHHHLSQKFFVITRKEKKNENYSH